jgi:hypothetical protein
MSTVVGAFASDAALRTALPRLHDAGFVAVETYTPMAPDGGGSLLPLAVLIGGLAGAAGGFLLQVYADTVSYPMNIGGRPDFSWPAFVPIAFELGVLSAMLTGLIGLLVATRLPRLHDPIDASALLPRASFDRWCVAIRTDDTEQARRLLWRCNASAVEDLGT